MIVLGVPREVKSFFSKTVASCSRADPARLGPDGAGLSPGSSSTLPQDDRWRGAGASLSRGHDLSPPDQSPMADAGLVLGLYSDLLGEVDAWERRQAKGKRRQWIVAIDTTYHATMSEQMENLIVMSGGGIPRGRTLANTPF